MQPRSVCFLLCVAGFALSGEDIHPFPERGAEPRKAGPFAEPIATDRPGYSDGVNIVPPGLFHWESGFSLNLVDRGAGERERNLLTGTPVLRIGLHPRFELRLGGDGVLHHSHRAGASRHFHTGLADVAAGFKFALDRERRWTPALTLISMYSAPVGAAEFSSGGVDPSVKLAWSKTAGADWTVSGNLVAASLTTGDQGERLTQKAATLQLSRPLWAGMGAFGELYAASPVAPEEPSVWVFDAGVTQPLGDYLQMDLSFGQQMAPRRHSWFLSVGLAVRGSLTRWGRIPGLRF